MAEGTPVAEQPSLHEMLAAARVHQRLPEDTNVLPADSIIADASRRELTDALYRAIGANKSEELSLSLTRMQFAEAARRLRTATGAPSRESIEPSEAGRAPNILSLYALLSDDDSEQTGYAVYSDPEIVAAAVSFDVTGRAYDTALARKEHTQQEASLAEQVRSRRKRLSLIPRALIITLSTAILGGGAYAVNHDIQTHAQEQLTKTPGMSHSSKRYEELRRDASPVQTDLLSGVGLLAGIGGGALAAWGAESEIARYRARAIVRRAQQVGPATR